MVMFASSFLAVLSSAATARQRCKKSCNPPWKKGCVVGMATHDDITASEYGYKVIGQWECGELEIYPEVMGSAGHRWSQTSYDD